MSIKGFVTTSLIDYPGKICSVLFLGGCNFRCPYCQNPDLVTKADQLPDVDESEIFGFLEKRKEWVDGVCITGGEPCLYPELKELIKKIKSLGFLVKLDTNGSNPELLKELIDEKLIDYVAMDVKATPEKYPHVIGVPNFDVNKIKKSVEILKAGNVNYEFRTTVVPKLTPKEDIIKIAEWLRGAKAYYLQQFRPMICLDRAYEHEHAYSIDALHEIYDEIKPLFEKSGVRNV